MVVPVSGILLSPRETLAGLKGSVRRPEAIFIQMSSLLSALTGILLFLDKRVTFRHFCWIYAACAFVSAAYKFGKAMLTHFCAESFGGEGRMTDR